MMSKELIKKIAIVLSLVLVTAVGGYFMWQQVRLENQLDQLKQFCSGLPHQASVDEIQSSISMSPTLRLILLTTDADGSQVGKVYVAGATRGSCDLTLSRGRLMGKSFSFGYQDPDHPGQKLKPW